jgi:hypothetical protein
MNRDNRAEKPLWANLRDTHGRDVPSTNPFARLISAHPALRGKDAGELASALGIAPHEAEAAIMAYVHGALPPALVPHAPGRSVDARLMMAGRPAPAGWVSSSREGARVETHGPRGESAGLNDTFRGVLPLGFGYKMPDRSVRAQDGTLVSVPAPTAYDAQCATILRADVPSDPNDAGMPRSDVVRAFCVAMGGDLVAAAPDGLAPFQFGNVAPENLTPSARGVVEEVGSWPAPQPGEVFNGAAIRNAFAAFKWYAPLSGDTETDHPSWSWDDSDKVTRERYVFWYLQDDSAQWQKCVQVQGFSNAKNTWILPSKWGESIQCWAWRPTDSQYVGEWRTFFSWDRWNNENKSTIAGWAVWIAAAAVTLATLGAGAGVLAGAAAFQAAMYALKKLYDAVGAGDPAVAVAAAVELGRNANAMADGDFLNAMAKGNPGLAEFTGKVAAPFAKIYDAAGGAAATVESVWSQATALQSQVPKVNEGIWATALNTVGAGDAARGAGAWLQMARLPSSAEVAGELWANAPSWAKDLVALGVGLSAAEQGQARKGGGVMQSLYSVNVSRGGGMMQLSPSIANVVRSTWSAVPPPASEASPPSLVPVQSSGGSSAAAPLLLAGAAAALWFVFGRK